MRRHVTGIVAFLLLSLGAYFLIWPPSAGQGQLLSGACIRLGMVLFAIWLAYPQVQKIPRWMYGLVLLAAAVVLVFPKAIIYIIPAMPAIWFLRPRNAENRA